LQVLFFLGSFYGKYTEPKGGFIAPNDQSLDAYKAWIRELINRFTTGNEEIKLTEQEWIQRRSTGERGQIHKVGFTRQSVPFFDWELYPYLS
jgi:hypothetical protein